METWTGSLPKQIKIWGHTFDVKRQKDPKHFNGTYKEDVYGLIKYPEQQIVLSHYLQKHKSREVEVFLHEIMHGICYNSNVFSLQENKIELEEHVVDTVANGLTLVLKDNVSIIDYIKENLHD